MISGYKDFGTACRSLCEDHCITGIARSNCGGRAGPDERTVPPQEPIQLVHYGSRQPELLTKDFLKLLEHRLANEQMMFG